MSITSLREAIDAKREALTSSMVDPVTEVTVASGCTETLTATFLGLFNPDNEIVLFEPTHNAYPAGCALWRCVSLRHAARIRLWRQLVSPCDGQQIHRKDSLEFNPLFRGGYCHKSIVGRSHVDMPVIC
jgi:hypothetical protein